MNTLTVKDHKEHRTIPLNKIEYVAGNGNYSTLYIEGETPVTIAQTLKVVEVRLPGFIRIHKTRLVNPDHIVEYRLRGLAGAFVMLTNNRALEIARRRVKAIKVYADAHR